MLWSNLIHIDKRDLWLFQGHQTLMSCCYFDNYLLEIFLNTRSYFFLSFTNLGNASTYQISGVVSNLTYKYMEINQGRDE